MRNLKRSGIIGLLLTAVLVVAALGYSGMISPNAAIGFGVLPVVFGMALATPVDSVSNLRTLAYTHSSSTAAGEVIVVSNTVLVAVNAKGANAENAYIYQGKITFPKEASLAIALLAEVYWDAVAGCITTTSSGNTACGFCITAAADSDATVDIILTPNMISVTSEIALADGKVLIGGVTGVAAEQTLSGDVTITNAGEAAIGAKKVTAAKTALADGKILVGGADGAAAEQTMSGDVTITNAGEAAIGAKKVTAAKTAIADGKIFVGGADGAAAEKTLSGDVTMTNEGVTAIGAEKVLKGMVAFKAVEITVSAGNPSGASAADPDLVAGQILGVYPTSNQDQFVDSIVLGGDGAITVVLAAAATADNVYKVVVLRAA